MTNTNTYDHLSPDLGRKLQQIQRTNMWKPYLTEGVQKRFIPNPNKFKVIWAKEESRQSSYLALLYVVYYDGIHVRLQWIRSWVSWKMKTVNSTTVIYLRRNRSGFVTKESVQFFYVKTNQKPFYNFQPTR